MHNTHTHTHTHTHTQLYKKRAAAAAKAREELAASLEAAKAKALAATVQAQTAAAAAAAAKAKAEAEAATAKEVPGPSVGLHHSAPSDLDPIQAAAASAVASSLAKHANDEVLAQNGQIQRNLEAELRQQKASAETDEDSEDSDSVVVAPPPIGASTDEVKGKRGPTPGKTKLSYTRVKGAYFAPAEFPVHSDAKARLDQRATFDWGDVETYFGQVVEGTRTHPHEGLFGLIVADPPWGYLPSVHHDKPWPPEMINSVACSMKNVCAPNGTVLIFCGSDSMNTQWRSALDRAGFSLEYMSKILSSGNLRQFKKSNKWVSSYGITIHQFMVVATNCKITSRKRVLNHPYGVFGKDSFSSVQNKVPHMRNKNRLSDESGTPFRFQETSLDVWCEVISRYSSPRTKILDLCSGTGSCALAALKLNRSIHSVERDKDLVQAVTARCLAFLAHLSLGRHFRQHTGTAPEETKFNGLDSYTWQREVLRLRDIGPGVLVVPKSNIPYGWPKNTEDFEEWCTAENLVVKASDVFGGVFSLFVTTKMTKGQFLPGGLCGEYRGNVPRKKQGRVTFAIQSTPGPRSLYLQGGEYCAAAYGRDPAHPDFAETFASPSDRPAYNARLIEDPTCPFGSVYQVQIELTTDLEGSTEAPVEVVVDQHLQRPRRKKGTPARSSPLPHDGVGPNLRPRKKAKKRKRTSDDDGVDDDESDDGDASFEPDEDDEDDDDGDDAAGDADVGKDAVDLGDGADDGVIGDAASNVDEGWGDGNVGDVDDEDTP